MKRTVKWTVGIVLVIGIGVVGYTTLQQKKQKENNVLQGIQNQLQMQQQLTLNHTDLVELKPQTLLLNTSINGTLKAVHTASIKTKISGELQGLSLREGDSVKQGQLLAHVDAPDAIYRNQQANEQARAAKSQLDIAQRQLDTNQALVKQGFISPNGLHASQATLAGAQATHNAALANAQLAKKSITDMDLRSPIDGVVSQKILQSGEKVSADAKILEIVDLRQLEVEVALSPVNATRVEIGQTAHLKFEAGKTVATQVIRINPTAQAGTHAVLVYLQVNNNSSLNLRQGLFVQGTLLMGESSSGLVLPWSAVRTDKPLPYVQTVNAKGILSHVNVVLKEKGVLPESDEPFVVVESPDLSTGSRVVKGSLGLLSVGSLVTVSQNT